MKIADRRLLELLDRRSLDELIQREDIILVGVSGGADSVALLRALSIFRSAQSIKVVHVNHGVRVESDAEAAFVTRLCDDLDVELFSEKLSSIAKPAGESPEAYWRRQRYSVFQNVMKLTGAKHLALGHTADDMAETFLYHLARGTGITGLTFQFMKTSSGLSIIRPLWKTRRSEIENALQGAGQEWVTDPSNFDVQFSRNRIRAQVIPALEEINPSAVTAIVNLADQLSTSVSSQVIADSSVGDLLCVSEIRDNSSAQIRETLRAFIVGRGEALPGSRNLEQAADLVKDGASGLVALPGAATLVLTQTHGWIFKGVEPEDTDLANEHVRRFGGFAAKVESHIHIIDDEPIEIAGLGRSRFEVSVRNSLGLVLRNRRSGDRVGPRTLKKLLIDYKVPWYLREFLVLAVSADGQVGAVCTDNTELNTWISHHARPAVEMECSNVHATA